MVDRHSFQITLHLIGCSCVITFTSILVEIHLDSQQDEIVGLYPQMKSVNCVKIPHHGKNVSDLFAQFFTDKIFVVSTGVYGKSVPDLRPLEKLKGRVLRTDQVGDIVVSSDGRELKVIRP